MSLRRSSLFRKRNSSTQGSTPQIVPESVDELPANAGDEGFLTSPAGSSSPLLAEGVDGNSKKSKASKPGLYKRTKQKIYRSQCLNSVPVAERVAGQPVCLEEWRYEHLLSMDRLERQQPGLASMLMGQQPLPTQVSGSSSDESTEDSQDGLSRLMPETQDVRVFTLPGELFSEFTQQLISHGINIDSSPLPIGNWQEMAANAIGNITKYEVVVVEVSGETLAEEQLAVLSKAYTEMLVPLAVSPTGPCAALIKAEQITQGTWPVFDDVDDLAEFLKSHELQHRLTLRRLILEDVNSRVSKYRKINVALHFTKRAPMAFVPFGVHAVNAAGIIRLSSRILNATGMSSFSNSNESVGWSLKKLAAVAGVKVAFVESLGDVYQFAVVSSVLATATATLAADGVAAALDTINVVDALTLGSVSVVTGAISAAGACATRPGLVDSMARLIGMRQWEFVLNPDRRQLAPPQPPNIKKEKEKKSKGKQQEKEMEMARGLEEDENDDIPLDEEEKLWEHS